MWTRSELDAQLNFCSVFLPFLVVTSLYQALSPSIASAGAWTLPRGQFWGKEPVARSLV